MHQTFVISSPWYHISRMTTSVFVVESQWSNIKYNINYQLNYTEHYSNFIMHKQLIYIQPAMMA